MDLAVQTGMTGIPATCMMLFLFVFCFCFEEFGIILHVDLLCCMKNRRRSDLSAASNRLIRAVRMRAQYAAEILAKWLLPGLLSE